jgi:hypothetical protein
MALLRLARVGIFDWFRKRGSRPEISREILFEAATADDLDHFAALCSEHADWIFANFAEWKTVPLEIRKSPAAVQAYARGLTLTANLFASNGRPELLEMIMPKGDDNPWFDGPRSCCRPATAWRPATSAPPPCSPKV